MLIPSIDLMDGKIVQLVQGQKKALEFENFSHWIARFSSFPLVQVIDLDAAISGRNNRSLVESLVQHLPCQVGGGIRSLETVRQTLASGARRVILGSVLIKDGQVNLAFARELAEEFGPDKLVFAVDARAGRVQTHGWRKETAITPRDMVAALTPWCTAFLYTHIDTEGLMAGLPVEPVIELRQATTRQLIVAGGISSQQEIMRFHEMGVDCVVGMALYSGRLQAADALPTAQ
jgi:phosphoribosylformimino-5-aminoimidazole carboxamide ribotide isomerase